MVWGEENSQSGEKIEIPVGVSIANTLFSRIQDYTQGERGPD